MAAIDVRCEHVSKRYYVRRRRRSGSASLANLFGSRTPDQEFWALRDVGFEVGRGETLGIVGRNGAGKSTLLKLLGGITAPTEGLITLAGKISAMIEVGSGFHPELTGRENVFLSGAILGMRRREIAARLDSIAEFSGVPAFLDTPVKQYSSGMYVRLGFAIAAHLEADILLVDEVLAVGDAEFQGRCMRRIQELKRRGTTMILVSHDLGAIEQLSDRAILIDGGRVAATGSAQDVISTYQRMVSGPDALPFTETDDRVSAESSVRITRLSLHDAAGAPVLTATAGEPLVARVALVLDHERPATVRLSFYDFDRGTLLTELVGNVDPETVAQPEGEVALEFVMPELLLAPGTYTLGVTATPAGAPQPTAWRFGRTTLYVQGRPGSAGVFAQPFECRMSTTERVSAETLHS
jgi:ABC-type polysaccharide/polyol phosphate transport system ATPase subunit